MVRPLSFHSAHSLCDPSFAADTSTRSFVRFEEEWETGSVLSDSHLDCILETRKSDVMIGVV